jgi:hypothetical protein
MGFTAGSNEDIYGKTLRRDRRGMWMLSHKIEEPVRYKLHSTVKYGQDNQK